MLANLLRVPHISIGSLLRSDARDESEVGLRLRGMMAVGNLVPDTLVLDVLAIRISEPDCARGLILDGFPRTLGQAELLERGLLKSPLYAYHLREKLVALHLRVQSSTIVERLSGRRICSRCSATYHLRTQPPRVRGECDFDGSALTIREDDHRATVLKRLRLTNSKPYRSSAITSKRPACWKSIVSSLRKFSLKRLSLRSRACSAAPRRVPRMSGQRWKTVCEMVR
jgi:adenylate kinase